MSSAKWHPIRQGLNVLICVPMGYNGNTSTLDGVMASGRQNLYDSWLPFFMQL